MLPVDTMKDLLSQKLLAKDKALICLASDPLGPRTIAEVSGLGYQSGWRQIKKKNLSSIYSRNPNYVVRLTNGWELTSEGKRYVAQLAGPLLESPVTVVASALRGHLSKISCADTQAFVEEAIYCFETRQHRAAVVLSWVGAISTLQNYVIANKLSQFNAEAIKRNPKWKFAKNVDDIGLMKEDTFLDILQTISVLGKNVKQELKKGLILRNGCGHPNSLKLAEHKVSAHIEDLVLNVFSVY